MHRRSALLFTLLLFVALGALGLAEPAYANTIPVTTTADEFGSGGGCSLREAIQAANTDAAFGGCPAGSGGDTITLQALTYTLTRTGTGDDQNQTGDLDVRSNITINGVGATSTIIDGGGLDRVVDVIGGTPISISGLTIRNGNVSGTGGGINNQNNGGTVTISDCIIILNSASNGGGLDNNNNGTFTITNCIISGNRAFASNGTGAGIDNSGAMTITNSTVSGNEASGSSSNGGGIDNNNSGVMTITGSTISGNLVRGNAGRGAGIDNSGTLTLTNSTISGNTAPGNGARGGGLANENGTANVTFTTITGNSATKGGSGILGGGGQVNLRATIVETSPLESTCDEQGGGDIVTQGSNVADDGTCFTGGLNGDRVVESVLLGPLTNNGGPTQTHLPQVGSPVLSAVLSGCPPPATDQRGVSRPSGARCDAGAVELAAGVLQLSSTTYSVQENGGAATITVTRSGSTTGAAGATLTLSGGTATAGADYLGTSFAVTFADGETSKTISVPIIDDALDGEDETVNVTLSSPTVGTVIGTPAAAVLTIVDDDAAPTVSISSTASAPEGNARTTSDVFTVTLSAASGRTVTVQAQTADGTATAGLDYVAVPLFTLIFGRGETVKTIPVQVLGDLLNEPDETFLVNLSNPTNATIGVGQGVGTIVDDDDPPALSIDDVTVIEGNAGSASAVFTVKLSAASSLPVTVQVQTANGTATAGSDYTPLPPTTVTFSPGEIAKTVAVAVLGDLLDEPDETFLVNLSNPSSAFIEDREAVGTIQDDDGAPTLHISGVTVAEGDAGTVDAVFTVRLLPGSGQDVTVVVQTADGTAAAGSDYTPVPPTTLRFPPGTTAQTITVKANGDVVDEADETFFVRLSGPQNATIASPEAVGTILDDDDPEVQIDDVTVVEGNSGSTNAEFTVSLKGPSEQTVVVEAVVVDGTATAGSDYTSPGPIRLTFPPGTISQPLTVAVTGDLLDEPDETFVVNLTAVSTLRSGLRPALFRAQGIGTIVDDDTATLVVDDVTVDEGDSGSVDAVFTVSLTTPSSETVTVVAQTADGTATAGVDYTAIGPVTLTFPAGTISETFTVPVLGDLLDETDETFVVNLTAPGLSRIARAQGLATIRDDDTAILSVNNVVIVEGDIGSQEAVFTVRLSTPSTRGVTVVVQTANGAGANAATAGSDYTAVGPLTLTFTPGVTSQTVEVPIIGDTADEPDEGFTVNLSNPSNAVIGDGLGRGRILNDDVPPAAQSVLSIGDVTVVEGNAGTVDAVFTVSLLPVSGAIVTVVAQTADGTATVSSDYTAVGPLTLTFTPGITSQTVTVPVNGDTVDESNEAFTVNLSNASNAVIEDDQGQGTILDDDVPPASPSVLSIGDVTVVEGDTGTVDAVFTVSLLPVSGVIVTVVAQTADGTATAGSDYTAVGPLTLTFTPGITSQTVTVPVNGDTVDESNEAFTVNLSNASNAVIEDDQGQGTILDDDVPPASPSVLSIGDVTVVEGDTGTVDAVFAVSLLPASSVTVKVVAQTANGTATAGSDYTAVGPVTLTFPPGTVLQTVVVPILGDTTNEPDQTFTVNLSGASNATIEDSQGEGTILDDDALPTASIGDVSILEGDSGIVNAVFTVSLSAASQQTVTVVVQTANGTATAGSDYTAVGPLTLTFAPGATSQTVIVPIIGDVVDEPNETFTVTLSGVSQARSGVLQGTGTIVDDDDVLPELGIGDVKIVEGDAGTVNAVFTVGLSVASTQTVSVVAQTADGTATAGSDYTALAPVTLQFPAGTVSRTVSVPIVGDTAQELDETFAVNLTGVTNATISRAQGVGTILDDDTPVGPGSTPAISIDDVGVVEGNVGATNATFTVRLSTASAQIVTVTAQTANGTATAGSDYTPVGPVTVTFNPGLTTQPVTVPILGDTTVEPDETFAVNLTAPLNATIADGQGLGTIRNDDGATPPQPQPPGPGPAPAPPAPPPVVSLPDPNNDDEKPRERHQETEDDRRERARTNRAGKDDEHIEGNVVEVYPDDRPPYVVIANRDGLVKVVLFKDAANVAESITVGDYLEADGEKQTEQLFYATDAEISRGGR